MLDECDSDTRQFQVKENLQQLRLRNVMTEERLEDVEKGLSTALIKVELMLQGHQLSKTDWRTVTSPVL